MSEVSEDVKQRVFLGADVENFLKSSVGIYLIKRAEEMVENATESLKTADAENPKTIRTLQHAVAIGESIQYWLGEAVNDSLAAEREYAESQSPD